MACCATLEHLRGCSGARVLLPTPPACCVVGLPALMPSLHQGLREGDAEKAQLGLGHAYSRSKVKFDVNRTDKHIIQSIALLDLLEKDINTFAMRVREWYSWHFPELSKVITDNYLYARCAQFVQRRESLTPERVVELGTVLADAEKAALVFEAAKTSMGMDISDIDLLNIHTFALRVSKLAEYRKVCARVAAHPLAPCAAGRACEPRGMVAPQGAPPLEKAPKGVGACLNSGVLVPARHAAGGRQSRQQERAGRAGLHMADGGLALPGCSSRLARCSPNSLVLCVRPQPSLPAPSPPVSLLRPSRSRSICTPRWRRARPTCRR